jgi:hypothetical protein
MNNITVNWCYGRPAHGAEEDERRARDAALKVLEGVDAVAAMEAFDKVISSVDADPFTQDPLADVWFRALIAADMALTSTWDKSDAASCEIMAY